MRKKECVQFFESVTLRNLLFIENSTSGTGTRERENIGSQTEKKKRKLIDVLPLIRVAFSAHSGKDGGVTSLPAKNIPVWLSLKQASSQQFLLHHQSTETRWRPRKENANTQLPPETLLFFPDRSLRLDDVAAVHNLPSKKLSLGHVSLL